MEIEHSVKPVLTSSRGCTLSVSPPTTGAITRDSNAIGANSSEASSAE